jgi:hypothetical protein
MVVMAQALMSARSSSGRCAWAGRGPDQGQHAGAPEALVEAAGLLAAAAGAIATAMPGAAACGGAVNGGRAVGGRAGVLL